MRPAYIPKAFRAFGDGRIGDAAAYKAAALGASGYPRIEQAVAALADPLPRIDPVELQGCAAATVGHALAQFMRINELTPIVVSPRARAELASTSAVAVRYAILHDAFHVLLGFDASWPGELGVWSFVAAQRYSPAFARAAALARWFYPLIAPSQRAELKRQAARGLTLAKGATCLICSPIEHCWRMPLVDVRRQFGLNS